VLLIFHVLKIWVLVSSDPFGVGRVDPKIFTPRILGHPATFSPSNYNSWSTEISGIKNLVCCGPQPSGCWVGLTL